MIGFLQMEVNDMDKYVTGEIIKRLREEKKMTQSKLAEVLQVSDKAVSKWGNGQGLS